MEDVTVDCAIHLRYWHERAVTKSAFLSNCSAHVILELEHIVFLETALYRSCQ